MTGLVSKRFILNTNLIKHFVYEFQRNARYRNIQNGVTVMCLVAKVLDRELEII